MSGDGSYQQQIYAPVLTVSRIAWAPDRLHIAFGGPCIPPAGKTHACGGYIALGLDVVDPWGSEQPAQAIFRDDESPAMAVGGISWSTKRVVPLWMTDPASGAPARPCG